MHSMIKLGKTEIPFKYPYMEYRGLVIAGPMDLIVLLLYIYCTCSGFVGGPFMETQFTA